MTQTRHTAATKRIGLVLGAFALSISACGDSTEPSLAIDEPIAPTTTAAPATTTTPPPTIEETPVPSYPDVSEGTWVATATGEGVEAWLEKPDLNEPTEAAEVLEPAADWWFQAPTQFDGPRVFLALETEGPLLKVSLPIQPNGTTGWIRADSVSLEQITFRAEVDLANYQLTVWDGSDVIVQTTAAIGKPATPTPLGEFYVRDVIPSRSSGSYGSFIIAMSGFSETLESFNGGLPAIAIHGTNRPDLVGQEVSNGCIRIPNEFVELLAATVPLGTPVTVIG